MKKTIFGIAAALMLAAAPAKAADSTGAENYFTVEPSTVVVDPTTNMGTVVVYLENETADFNSFMMDFYLPEGFTIEKNNRGIYKVTFNNDDFNGKVYDHNATIAQREGFYRILGTFLSATAVATGKDWLFRFNIIAPEGFQNKTEAEQASVRSIEIASGNTAQTAKVHYMPDIEFSVAPQSVVTGIEDVTVDAPAADGEEVIYDLTGRRVYRPLMPGIYIINGQKYLIK